MQVLPYNEIHMAGVKEIFTSIFDDSETQYVDFQPTPFSQVLVDSGIVKGFILIRNSTYVNFLHEIAYLGVSEECRNQGYATKLINTVKELIPMYDSLWLRCCGDSLAIPLYEKNGFRNIKFVSYGNESGALTFFWSS